MHADDQHSSPANSAVLELDRLRALFREAIDQYAMRVDLEISKVQEKVATQASKPKIPDAKMRDLRDMLTILRNTQIKSEKGRRKDIKKIDAMVGDLHLLTEKW
jgi:hypothetical protein